MDVHAAERLRIEQVRRSGGGIGTLSFLNWKAKFPTFLLLSAAQSIYEPATVQYYWKKASVMDIWKIIVCQHRNVIKELAESANIPSSSPKAVEQYRRPAHSLRRKRLLAKFLVWSHQFFWHDPLVGIDVTSYSARKQAARRAFGRKQKMTHSSKLYHSFNPMHSQHDWPICCDSLRATCCTALTTCTWPTHNF